MSHLPGRSVIAGVLLGIGLIAPSAAADTYPRQPGVDAINYAFRLTLRDDSDEIAGETTADLRFVQDGLAEFTLDLATPAHGKGMTVSAVTSNGKDVRYTHENNRLRVTLDPPSKANERRQFVVKYAGIPATGLRIGANRHNERTFFSQNWPDLAHQWLPVIDHPYDKATSEFIVTAPSKYQVVANGLLQEETDLGDGRRLTHWKQSVPIASWLNALGVAQFSTHYAGKVNGIPLQTWVFHQDRDAGYPTFEGPARRAIEFYSEYVGPYPFEKIGSVQAAGVNGGMEHASAVFYGQNTVAGGRPAASLVAHELAHQWFGDSVTEKDWDDIWLSEGFATYFALLYSEHYDGREAFVAGLKRTRTTALNAGQRASVVHSNLSDTRQILNPQGVVYQKGGWVLHMLRQIGTDQFWAGIREYYRRFRDSNVSTDELRRVMEETSGQDLAWFFQQWLKRSGSPTIDGGWKYNAESKKIEIELTQKQPGDPYRLPLEIGINQDATGAPRVVKVELTQATQKFEFAADREPASIVLDPNTWMLMQSTMTKR